MEARKMGISLTPEEQLEVFGTDRLPEYSAEAAERWGNSEAWNQSQRRTAAHGKEDWVEIKQQADENLRAFAAAMGAGHAATSRIAADLAEAHRLHISRWFYDCSHDRHKALAELYVSDRRFERTYEQLAPGLARYVHDAVVANAERARA
jgi:hypothetical protein